MKCLFITQEYAPFFAEGGLGLTSRALPDYLQTGHGIAHDLILPYYPWLMARQGLEAEEVCALPAREVAGVCSAATILRLRGWSGPGEIYLVRSDEWYARGGIYCDTDYVKFADEAERSAFFGWCVAEWVERGGCQYDLVHGNDWQSGAALAHLRARNPRLPVILTVHNALYRGDLTGVSLAGLGLPEGAVELLEREGDAPSMLLLGLLEADAAVTCSPAYARELVEELRGTAVGGALERLGTTGIIFGVDPELWDPAAIDRSSVPFDAETVDEGKRLNKLALQKHLNLRVDDAIPLLGVCSRLVAEKGTDLLLDALAPMLRQGVVQLALVGPATHELRSALEDLRAEVPDDLGYLASFDQDTAWLLYAGSDFTVMPSRTEPCGLNQLIAYRYGTLPLVSPVGGLRDTVTDLRTDPVRGGGMLIPEHTAQSVRATVQQAVRWMTDRPTELSSARRRVMKEDWSWRRTAMAFAGLYAHVAALDGCTGGAPSRTAPSSLTQPSLRG